MISLIKIYNPTLGKPQQITWKLMDIESKQNYPIVIFLERGISTTVETLTKKK